MKKYDYPELNRSLQQMQEQNELYKPTAFWSGVALKIVDDIRMYGIDAFRSYQSSLGYFVPTYGMPGNSFSPEQAESLKAVLQADLPQSKKALLGLEQYLTGYTAAMANYRVLLAADDASRKPSLHAFSECDYGQPVEQFEFDGRRFSRSSLNYLLGLSLLKKHLRENEIHTVMEIGGGFGSLGEVLAAADINRLRYIDIDIPPTSFVAQSYLTHALGADAVAGYAHTCSMDDIHIEDLPRATVLCSWQIEKLRGAVDLFVNFISFQEMEPPVVRNYLNHAARLNAHWILLRNIREGKQIRKTSNDVGVDQPILGNDYLDMLPGYHLVERNVIPFGYRTVDRFHSELQLLKKND
ncbi:MAG: putative sugar O-methyltransferase [Verrucomicrobiae bacterium]|nr:putative sugar O-methyltransferase [Verrucomicrobiae bacterium]